MRGVNRSVFSLFVLLAIGCSRSEPIKTAEFGDERRFRYYNLENRGWRSTVSSQSLEGISFSATDVPIQYYVLKEQGASDLKFVDSVFNANSKERIFEFELKRDDERPFEGSAGMSQEQLIEYLSFKVQDDFFVVTSKHDTIPCQGSNFERTYKIAPYYKILLFFNGIPESDPVQLVYRDRIFENGTIKFKFSETPIQL